ncbi:MAG: PocR ligand-binding domain-containing protein [Acetatifactor sp.]
MEQKINLIDYIDVERLQELQDSFSRLVGVAAGISDDEGNSLTQHVGACDFCKYTKSSKIGAERCRKCDSEGAALAMREGRAVSYTCHAGLIDFVAPIVIDGKMVGCFCGGQVNTGEPDVERVRRTAEDIGADPDQYLFMASRTRTVSEEQLQKAVEFIDTVTHSISDMADKAYQLEHAKAEVEYAAKLKADFLANMSHEIRTPMNGVIGMAELALREELPAEAREYINQIKVSGKTLLTIINDILDFSKIESGKMELTEDEYEPLSIVNDVTNVVLTRIGDKPVELVVDVDHNLPSKLWGDNIRIKQILLNIANNAVKFTQAGSVFISLGFEWTTENSIELKVKIQDTGIGIKEEDIKKLFRSFQQVDSKRNRQVEGTGLGLAISKQLVELMKGEVGVESTYGEGSTFWFRIPQKVRDKKPSIRIMEQGKINAVCIVENLFVREQLKTDIKYFGGTLVELPSVNDLTEAHLNDANYLFVDETVTDGKTESIANMHSQLTVVCISDFRRQVEFKQNNIVFIKKPVYALNLANLFNNKSINSYEQDSEKEDYMFIAPSAHILIVDDNGVNLTVAVGLLKPLQMQVDTAFSGKEALDMIVKRKYDLIFMDHMMPELDGVETTRIIRRMHPEYNDVPIIALTANVVSGAKEMFISEGMNDIVAKPIEMKAIVAKLHYWLPADKQTRVGTLIEKDVNTECKNFEIPGLDTQYALGLLGSKELYMSVMKDYYRVIDKKTAVIRAAVDNCDWGNYTIEVHALKSASRQIGAVELADRAAEMEKAGNARDIDLIRENTSAMLEQYQSYKDILGAMFQTEKEEEDKQPSTDETLGSLLQALQEAMDNLDMDEMDRVKQELLSYSYEESRAEVVRKLCDAVEDIDVDTCEVLAEQLIDMIAEG